MSEHKQCNIDGCLFTAHEKIVEKHIQMQHTTGLYSKIGNLSSPEDITRWIAERKRNYPSRENVEKQHLKRLEMLKRGERIFKKKGRFAKDDKTRCKH